MSDKKFESAMEAEAFFYEALQRGDLGEVMAAWADDETVVCIHPMGPALEGQAAVRDGWQVICESGQSLSFNVVSVRYEESGQLAVHVVREEITMAGKPPKEALMLATNVYRNTEEGWRMVLHHSSPGASGESVSSGPVVLH
jgi:ketosteroid isomerase-like protein